MRQYFKDGAAVVFYGDSITDAGRRYEEEGNLGNGYPAKTAAIYNALFAGAQVRFYNKGISGNRSIDLLKRYDAEIKPLAPDFISILIGINDTWRRYDSNSITTAEEFENNYRTLLTRIREDLPQCKIMMIEPYLLESDPSKLVWLEDLNPKLEAVHRLKDEFADYYLPLGSIFKEAVASGIPDAQISADGVHPADYGHGMIALEYLKVLGIL